MLRKRDATVTQCHSKTAGLEEIVRFSSSFPSSFYLDLVVVVLSAFVRF